MIFGIIGSLLVGIALGFLLSRLLGRKKSSDGDIVVIKKDDKLIYRLELADDPENLQFKTRAIFNIVASDGSDRE